MLRRFGKPHLTFRAGQWRVFIHTGIKPTDGLIGLLEHTPEVRAALLWAQHMNAML